MTTYRIPYNRPGLAGSEIEYMRQAIESGHLSGDGQFTRQCHTLLEELLGVPRVLLTTSCTHALEMAALLLRIAPGDEVIIPAFTFVSSVNAFVLRGAQPVFADIRPDTLNLDESQLEGLITPRTRAVVLVHYAGVGCEMDSILEIAARHNLTVVEDNAHGLFGRYKGHNLGTFGSLATQSFHETKNISCGEGGALVINDPTCIERAEIIREKGTDRSRFFRGQVDKYGWVDMGSSYLPSELLAAFLYAQLEQREQIQSKRQQIWYAYSQELKGWAESNGVQLPHVPEYCEQPSHLFYMLMPTLAHRQQFIAHLRQHGIMAVFHYLPLNTSPMGQGLGARPGDCPITESVSDRLVRLPLYADLAQADLVSILEAVTSFRVE